MQELERNVVRGRRRRGRHAVIATISLVALGGGAALAAWAYTREPTLVVVEHTPPPVIVTVERPAPPPPPPEPPPAVPAPTSGVACPVLDPAADVPIGTAVTPVKREDEEADARFSVVASAAAPRIAILAGDHVLVSDDDGAHFSAAFTGHDVSQIAVSRDGTLYAIDGNKLGVREFPGTRDVWRRVPGAVCKESGECPWCDNRIATVDERLVWFHSSELSVTSDRGHSWKSISTDGTAWTISVTGPLLAYRGSLYQVEDYADMCGDDETFVWRLTGTGKIDEAEFHKYFYPRERVLEPDDDVGTEWRWRERCWHEEDVVLTSCARRVPAAQNAMLRVARLRPVEGARALSVYGGALVELCEDGARQVYRSFPFQKIDAVDAQGRPLVVHGRDLLRWSPVHGWRRLYRRVLRPDE